MTDLLAVAASLVAVGSIVAVLAIRRRDLSGPDTLLFVGLLFVVASSGLDEFTRWLPQVVGLGLLVIGSCLVVLASVLHYRDPQRSS